MRIGWASVAASKPPLLHVLPCRMESIAGRRAPTNPLGGIDRRAETLSTIDNRRPPIAASTTGLEILANGASIAPKGLPLSLEL